MRKEKGHIIRHCHECGRPIGSGHRRIGLCRACANEGGYWLRSDGSGWNRNERREMRMVEDSVLLDDALTQNRKRQDALRQPPRIREYLPVWEELEMREVNGVTTFLEDRNAEVA